MPREYVSPDLTDPVSVTNVVIDQFIRARKRGRPLRRNYDQVHIAVLQTLDELRGVPQVHRGPWHLSIEHLRRWLLNRRPETANAWGGLSPAAQAAIADAAEWLFRRGESDAPAILADLVRWLQPARTRREVLAALEALSQTEVLS